MREPNRGHHITQNQQYTVFKVLQHIDDNIHTKLQLNELAAAVSYSPFHFHRLFKSVMGVNLNEYITNYRLQKVTRYLKLYPHLTLTEVAERCGYASLNDLSRKMKAYYGQTATQLREGYVKNRKICIMDRNISERYFKVNYYNEIQGDGRSPFREERSLKVTVKSLPRYLATFYPLLENGELHYQSRLKQAFQQLPRTVSGNPHSFQSQLVGRIHYEPTPDDGHQEWRYDACITIPMGMPDLDIPTTHIPGGTYAVLRLLNHPDDKKVVLHAFYQEWLPSSGYRLRDQPCLEVFGSSQSWQTGLPPYVDYCIPLLD